MQSFKDKLRQYLAHKHLGKEMIGVITLKTIKTFFGDPLIDGYVRFNKIFIKTSNQQTKIDLFKKKKEILGKVNDAIGQLGYASKMVEIFIK
jgi:hypothetical protein